MRTWVVLALLVAAPASARHEEDFGGGAIVYARGSSLWKTDAKGKGPELELVTLPGKASEIRTVRSDAAGAQILFDDAGTWWLARLGGDLPAKPSKLGCADAPARFSADGTTIVCADADGHALLVAAASGKTTSTSVPADGARVIGADGAHELIWGDKDGIWKAPVADLTQKQHLAASAPVRGLLPAPDGKRGLAIYPGHVYDQKQKKQKVAADVLATFALDGKAARRMLFRDGVVIDWSWDSKWVLVQHGDSACITRAVGGEYKCWKGYTAVSIAPDGRWGLLLGAHASSSSSSSSDGGGKHHDDRNGGEGEDKGDDSAAPAETTTASSTALPAAPFSLYRAKLEGAHTERPSLVERDLDGAALWLPAAGS